MTLKNPLSPQGSQDSSNKSGQKGGNVKPAKNPFGSEGLDLGKKDA